MAEHVDEPMIAEPSRAKLSHGNTKNTSPIPVTPGNPPSGLADESTPLIPIDSGGRAIVGLTNKFDIVNIYSVDL